MWIMTSFGFFSIVEAERRRPTLMEEDDLIVRARVRSDLVRFCAEAGIKPGRKTSIETTPERDYRYRVRMSRHNVAKALIGAVMDLHYPNFKDKIHRGEPHRAHIYGDVWRDLLQLKDLE
jgi:hypothetical protein